MSRSQVQPWPESFSTRETEILGLISDGLTNREIAQRLHLSLDTVKWYNKQIFSKLGVSSRTQAASKAADLGLFVDADAPPRQTNHNLPAQLNSFIGRHEELAEIKKILTDTRLLVLTGPGGSGKTRLALQAAGERIGTYRDGVWLVELASITNPAEVADAIAQVLSITAAGEIPAEETLKLRLKNKQLLLVLDNFEHLLEAAPVAGEILIAAPEVAILATSRERLNIYGEREYSVHPLSLPASDRAISPINALDYEAVRLFAERAQTANPDLALDDRQMPAVLEICRRLDGLPLAIELAASQARFLPPVILVERLNDNLSGLPDGPRDAPARQRTLQATIEWSYSLLDDWEKALFARLSIFQGGSTLNAIEEVCFPGLAGDPIDTLTSLVEKNLVVSRMDPIDTVRFSMLETIREFSRHRLSEAGELEVMRERHAAYYADLAERAELEIRGHRHQHWFGRLRVELENLRLALRWSLDGDHPEYGLRMVTALQYFWYYGGFISEAQEWCQLALDRSDQASPLLRAGVLRSTGWFLEFSEPSEGWALLSEALRIYRKHGLERSLAFILAQLGANVGPHPPEIRLKEGQTYAIEALEIFRRIGDEGGLVFALNVLGENSRMLGDYQAAKQYYEECLQSARQTGELLRIPMQYGNLSYIAYHQRDYESGLALGRNALIGFQELGNDYGIVSVMANIAGCLTPLGKAKLAAVLLGANEALLGSIGAQRQTVDQAQIEAYIAEAKESLGEAAFREAWQQGQNLTLDEAVDLALGS